jgi:hypothetical protein
MHIKKSDIPRIRSLFKSKYNRELIGEEQGMFHSDFESKLGEVAFASRSIFLGKKFYIDELTLENGLIDYHIRAKGLPSDCLEFKAKELGINPFELY